MGEWRHFGERLEFATLARECGGVPDLFRPAPGGEAGEISRSDSLRAELGRVIEGEILPRLMLAHRDAEQPARRDLKRGPSQEQIDRFSTMLLDPREENVTAHVMSLLDEGLPLDNLLLDLLAPAARHLGALWEEDACDFMDVTLGVGRLHAVARELYNRLEDEAGPSNGRSILLLACPGETHVFCLSLVASFFREAGWEVTTAGSDPGLDMIDLVRVEWFDVIGLTLSCEVLLPAMTQAVRDLRKASCNRSARIIVGGPYFSSHPDHVQAVGADATADDGRFAPRVAESLLEKRARAC